MTNAEKGKAKVYKSPGRKFSFEDDDENFFFHTLHIDSNLVVKIEKGQFVDLEKLLPREKILHKDGRLNIIEKDGISYFQLVSEKESPSITNIRKWEQAFHLYATIFSEKHPHKANELLKHMFNI